MGDLVVVLDVFYVRICEFGWVLVVDWWFVENKLKESCVNGEGFKEDYGKDIV